MNIKELKEAIKNLPDEMLVYTEQWQSDPNGEGTDWPVRKEAISASTSHQETYNPNLNPTSYVCNKHGHRIMKYGQYVIDIFVIN